MEQMTVKEWEIEGEKRFGEDKRDWRFICPRCNTVQTARDLLAAGVSNEDAKKYIGFSCVGRFTKEKGCNWTLGGLFQIHELIVVCSDGEQPLFRFADKQNLKKKGGD